MNDSFPMFRLSKDGKEIMKGSEFALLDYIHNNTCGSMAWACKYEGYSVEPA